MKTVGVTGLGGLCVGVANFFLGQSIGIWEQYTSVKIFILASNL